MEWIILIAFAYYVDWLYEKLDNFLLVLCELFVEGLILITIGYIGYSIFEALS